MDKIERLLTLMNVLLASPRAMSADELRARVPGYPPDDASWKRAFERDKDELRSMGVPLLVETVPASNPPLLGYRIRPQDYELRDPGLTPDELEALNLAAAVTGLAGGDGTRALQKLGGRAPDAPASELPADANLVAAFTGVAERRTLAFTYRDLAREVHPYRLEFVRSRWYLNGFDLVRGEDRWFRLDRVQGAIEVASGPEAFERPAEAVPGLQLDPWTLGGEQPIDAEVRFDREVAPTVVAAVGASGVIAEEPDGIVVRLPVSNREGFISWVMSYLERAEVVGPPELRAQVIAHLEAVAAR